MLLSRLSVTFYFVSFLYLLASPVSGAPALLEERAGRRAPTPRVGTSARGRAPARAAARPAARPKAAPARVARLKAAAKRPAVKKAAVKKPQAAAKPKKAAKKVPTPKQGAAKKGATKGAKKDEACPLPAKGKKGVKGKLNRRCFGGGGAKSDDVALPNRPAAAAALQTILANPTVQQAFQAAWDASFLPDQGLGEQAQEQGGWIYQNARGQLTTRARTGPGVTTDQTAPSADLQIDLNNPPTVRGSFVVATYHTHPLSPTRARPNGASGDDRIFPSRADFDEHMTRLGVPGFIITRNDVAVTGPPLRAGGLSGPAGFPSAASVRSLRRTSFPGRNAPRFNTFTPTPSPLDLFP